MNNERRKQINKVINVLDILKNDIERICECEQDAYDNMPEGIQCSVRGETSVEAINNLEDSIERMEDLISSLTDSTI